jgi:hypothetical protein
MTNTVKLINNSITSSTGLKLLHGTITYGWKNQVTADSGEGYFGDVEAQFNGWENPTINLLFHIPVGNSTYAEGTNWMNWAKWNDLVKNQYINTADTATSLVVTVGDTDIPFYEYSLSTSSTGTSNPKIQIKNYTLSLSPDESRNAYFWTINAQLVITK